MRKLVRSLQSCQAILRIYHSSKKYFNVYQNSKNNAGVSSAADCPCRMRYGSCGRADGRKEGTSCQQVQRARAGRGVFLDVKVRL